MLLTTVLLLALSSAREEALVLKETMKEGAVIAGCTGNGRDGGEPSEL